MELLSSNNLANIYGGKAAWWFAIGGVITFLLGVFDGIINPNKCKR